MSKIEFEPTDNKVGCFIYTNLKEVKKDQKFALSQQLLAIVVYINLTFIEHFLN